MRQCYALQGNNRCGYRADFKVQSPGEHCYCCFRHLPKAVRMVSQGVSGRAVEVSVIKYETRVVEV